MTVLYSPGDVQELLGVDSSTLRKYAALLEGHGYQIHRNNRGHRGYFEKDVTTLRKVFEISKQQGMTMEQSVEAVMVWVAEENKAVTTAEVVSPQPANDLEIEQDPHDVRVVERMDRLEQINMELINHLKEKAIREAKLEEMLTRILKYVEKSEHLEAQRMKAEETRMQIAASSQKKWWKWWK